MTEPVLRPDPEVSFPVVIPDSFPHGLRCATCHRPIDVGDPYAPRLSGVRDDGTPICILTCVLLRSTP